MCVLMVRSRLCITESTGRRTSAWTLHRLSAFQDAPHSAQGADELQAPSSIAAAAAVTQADEIERKAHIILDIMQVDEMPGAQLQGCHAPGRPTLSKQD